MTPARSRVAITAALGVALGVSGIIAAADGPHRHDLHAVGAAAPSVFEREMDASMTAMMEAMHASGYSGDADADFLAMMVPHHQGAVDMARLVLQHGHDPATRQLAEEIIAGQTVEIDSMRRRLALLKQRPALPSADFPSLGGTRGP